MKNYTLSFDQNQVDFLMAILGDLPTKTNAYLVLTSINAQLMAQAEQNNSEEKTIDEAA